MDVDPDPLYVSDGTIHTSAGTAAGIDLCLALVAADHGAEVAATVARRLVMPLHRPGGQAQYIDRPIEPPAAELGTLLDWAREHLGDGLRVDDLADPRRAEHPPARRASSPATSAPPRASGSPRSGSGSPSGCSSSTAEPVARDRPPRRLRVARDAARAVRGAAEHLTARLPRDVLGPLARPRAALSPPAVRVSA